MMEVMTAEPLRCTNLQSDCHHQKTNTQLLYCPTYHSTNSVKALKEIYKRIINEKLVPWGTDSRLPLIGDFRSLILE